MKRISFTLLAFFSVFLISCSHTSVALTPEGSQVSVSEYLSPDERKSLKEITKVYCEIQPEGGTLNDLEDNKERCMNALRNQAAAKGGSVLLVEREKQEYTFVATSGPLAGGRCMNCVRMSGLVFKKK